MKYVSAKAVKMLIWSVEEVTMAVAPTVPATRNQGLERDFRHVNCHSFPVTTLATGC